MTAQDIVEYINNHKEKSKIMNDLINTARGIMNDIGPPDPEGSLTFYSVMTIDNTYFEVHIDIQRKDDTYLIGILDGKEITVNEFLDQYNVAREKSKQDIHPVPGSEQQEREETGIPEA